MTYDTEWKKPKSMLIDITSTLIYNGITSNRVNTDKLMFRWNTFPNLEIFADRRINRDKCAD